MGFSIYSLFLGQSGSFSLVGQENIYKVRHERVTRSTYAHMRPTCGRRLPVLCLIACVTLTACDSEVYRLRLEYACCSY